MAGRSERALRLPGRGLRLDSEPTQPADAALPGEAGPTSLAGGTCPVRGRTLPRRQQPPPAPPPPPRLPQTPVDWRALADPEPWSSPHPRARRVGVSKFFAMTDTGQCDPYALELDGPNPYVDFSTSKLTAPCKATLQPSELELVSVSKGTLIHKGEEKNITYMKKATGYWCLSFHLSFSI